MIKECAVILNNDAVTVVKYDNTTIQFPSIHKNVQKVFVKIENNKRFIVDEKEYIKEKSAAEKAAIKKKKTTIEEGTNVIDTDDKENSACID